MENETLLKVFLAVIALGALLQAAVVAALAVGARFLKQKIAVLEEAVEQEVLPRLDSLAELAGRIVEVSGDALGEAERITESVTQGATRLGDTIGAVADRVAGVAGAAVDGVERILDLGERVVERPTGRSRALLKGLRRGFEVWRQGAGPARDY